MTAQAGIVTLEITKWDEMRDRIGTLTRAKEDLETKLREALSSAVGVDGGQVLLAFRAALDVCRFAVANLDPETVRGWPHERLTALAVALDTLPMASPDEKELGITFRVFAREAKDLEHERKLGIHKERQTVPRGSISPHEHEGLVMDNEGKPLPSPSDGPAAVSKTLSAAAEMARRFGAAPMAEVFDAQAAQAVEAAAPPKSSVPLPPAARESKATTIVVALFFLILLGSAWAFFQTLRHDQAGDVKSPPTVTEPKK